MALGLSNFNSWILESIHVGCDEPSHMFEKDLLKFVACHWKFDPFKPNKDRIMIAGIFSIKVYRFDGMCVCV